MRRVINFPERLDLKLRALSRETGLPVTFIVRYSVDRFFRERQIKGHTDFGMPFDYACTCGEEGPCQIHGDEMYVDEGERRK